MCYCVQNAVAGAPRAADLAKSADASVRGALATIAAKNRLDAALHARVDAAVVAAGACAFGDAAAAVDTFRRGLGAFQARACAAAGSKASGHEIPSALRDPSHRERGADCKRKAAAHAAEKGWDVM